MKYFVVLAAMLLFASPMYSQTPLGRSTGIGIILGDPTGITFKTTWSRQTDLTANIGSSYFGALRMGVDWTWNFDVFRSPAVHLYFGPGVALGVGSANGIFYRSARGDFYYRPAGEAGLGIRGVMGLSGTVEREPIEFFIEFGPMIGLVPNVGSSVDIGIGARFYP